MGQFLASKTFKVPKNTFKKYVKNKIKLPEELVQIPLCRPPVWPKKNDADLAVHCVEINEIS